ncbi:MAG: patatin-like phospholipase family protein [Candidatus Obscuribacterales bacterium]|nr:patatin-like phospholipase family protein [Candidatus Obscuribacterales bacterium]
MIRTPDGIEPGGFLAHYVISAGGSRAILAGCGSIFASQIAGLKWDTIGGVSGGSIPAVMLAAGMPPAQLLQFALEIDFREMCVNKAGKIRTLLAILLKEYHEHPENRPSYGIMETDKLGAFINSKVSSWPDKFWTMAVDGDSQIVFKKDGIFEYTGDGRCIQWAKDPGPVGFAVQATCAIPGVTQPPKLKGRYLFDGAFSKDGMCPVGVPIRHFGVPPSSVVGLCVGEDLQEGVMGMFRRFWKWIWGIKPDSSWNEGTAGVVDIHPHVSHIHALRFELTADEKWLAILEGFSTTVYALASHGTLKGERLNKALSILGSLPDLKTVALSKKGKPQKLAIQARQSFLEHGLLD